jgi:hypothetical protein
MIAGPWEYQLRLKDRSLFNINRKSQQGPHQLGTRCRPPRSQRTRRIVAVGDCAGPIHSPARSSFQQCVLHYWLINFGSSHHHYHHHRRHHHHHSLLLLLLPFYRPRRSFGPKRELRRRLCRPCGLFAVGISIRMPHRTPIENGTRDNQSDGIANELFANGRNVAVPDLVLIVCCYTIVP